jgi:hypothetical protein
MPGCLLIDFAAAVERQGQPAGSGDPASVAMDQATTRV